MGRGAQGSALGFLFHARAPRLPAVRRAARRRRAILAVALACACALMAKPTAVVLPRDPAAARLVAPRAVRRGRDRPGRAGARGRAALPGCRKAAARRPRGRCRGADFPRAGPGRRRAQLRIPGLGPLRECGGLAGRLPRQNALADETLVLLPAPRAGDLSPVAVAAAVLCFSRSSRRSRCGCGARTRTSPPAGSGTSFSVAPMSGVVQAGFQAMADRYTYLPLDRDRRRRRVTGSPTVRRVRAVPPAVRWGAAVALLCCCAALTPLQIATLARLADALQPRSRSRPRQLECPPEARRALPRRGRLRRRAIVHLRRSVELKPERHLRENAARVDPRRGGKDGRGHRRVAHRCAAEPVVGRRVLVSRRRAAASRTASTRPRRRSSAS